MEGLKFTAHDLNIVKKLFYFQEEFKSKVLEIIVPNNVLLGCDNIDGIKISRDDTMDPKSVKFISEFTKEFKL